MIWHAVGRERSRCSGLVAAGRAQRVGRSLLGIAVGRHGSGAAGRAQWIGCRVGQVQRVGGRAGRLQSGLGRVVWAQPVRAQRVCSYLVAAHSALFFWIWHARGGGHAGVGERGRARSTRGQVRLGLMAVWMGSAGTGRCAAGF